MKNILISLSLALTAGTLCAQPADPGFKQLYYERYQSAEATFHNALQQNPNDAAAWYGLARTYILEHKTADSIRLAPASVSDEPYYEVALGTVLLNEDKKDSAAVYFNEALDQTRKKDAGILAAVAQSNIDIKKGDAAYAVELLNQSIKRDKHNAALYVALGNAYRKLSNGGEAYKAYENALKENDKSAGAYYQLGNIFLTQKNVQLYLDYFNKAVAADPDHAPSLYKLYAYYFYNDAAKAMQYYKEYAAKSDASIENEYDLADLFYLNKNYTEAIAKAKSIEAAQGNNTKPRLFKLLGYSLAAANDTTQAISYMQRYFSSEADSNIVSGDYEIMAGLYASTSGNQDSSIAYFKKTIALEKDSTALYADYKKLADLYKDTKDYSAQAEWLGKYYTGNSKANNVDLFNWALAHYRGDEYAKADSVFGLYTDKYPEQGFGYYWRARSNVAIDTAMALGLAVPYYQKLIEVMQTDTANASYKKWMTEAYGYLAAYEANTKNDYAEAIDYFEKVLQIDPENESAKKYIAILQKDLTDKGSE
jgi:tetratricopeptide (TPR) repeat protein